MAAAPHPIIIISKDEFKTAFDQWKGTWFNSVSNDTKDWAQGPGWEKLVAMGESIVPFLIEELDVDPDNNFPALQLYDHFFAGKEGDVTYKKNHPLEFLLEGEQARTRRAVAAYKKMHPFERREED